MFPPELTERQGANHEDGHVGKRSDRVWLRADDCHLDDLEGLVARTTNPRHIRASEVASNVLIYEGDAVRRRGLAGTQGPSRQWVAMTEGLGIVVFRGAFDDLAPWTRPPITSGP